MNLDKTVWIVGGEIAASWVAPTFRYRSDLVRRVPSFRYLGLELTGHGFQTMVDARLASARKAWATLRGVLVQKGWRDRTTALLLFDTFVKTCLLYGVPVWGSQVLPRSGEVTTDRTGQVGAFYRGALRSIMGLGRVVRDAVVFVLAGRLPLRLHIAKALWRYADGLRDSSRLVASVVRWVWNLEATATYQRMSVVALQRVAERFEAPHLIYGEVERTLRSELRGAARLRGRELLGIWEHLLDLVLGRGDREVHLPDGVDLPTLRGQVGSFALRVREVRGARGQPRTQALYPPVRPSWQHLPDRLFGRLV